ncbi:MAG TPA: hypothetical protein VGL81_20080 [Polyangiaceae bacterium]
MRHSVFTIEVCARFDTGPQLLDALRPLVQSAPEHVSRDEAWQRHAAAANMLLQHIDVVERGCWEYFDDEARAKWMFDDWTRPVLERKIPRQQPSGAPGYRDAGARYLTFTMVYLLARDAPSDLELRRVCQIPEDQLWRKQTFRRLLQAVRTLSFGSVKADSMYLIPRDRDWGFTHEDLASETYNYLRPLVAD